MSQPTDGAEKPIESFSEEEMRQKRVDDLEKADFSADVNTRLLWETLSHCAEPADADKFLEQVEGDVARVTREQKKQELEAAEKEHSTGKYRVKFNGQSLPDRHPTWPAAFQLHVSEQQTSFYVLKSESDKLEDDEDVWKTTFAPNDPKTRIGEFGYWYACGKDARNANGNLVGEENGQIEFNYAEHKMLGEMLHLRWSDTEQTLGTKELRLPNQVALSYGEINGLGGDFFGGYNPVSNGKDLDERCKYFHEAFETLSNGAKADVSELLKGRQAEVNAIAKAVDSGKSTFTAYKELKKDAFGGLSWEDVESQWDTLSGNGPSYLRLAQINFDHFGGDARKAYDAGHYCALQEAAKGTPESLELAYAMNAFADHYLGDCFASGHFRTPRRALHGSTKGIGAAWDALSGMAQFGLAGNLNFLKGAMKVMVPDLLSMLMHNEDNKKGIVVTNLKGEQFSIWGDKQMFEPQNKKNKEMMRQGLQASVDEVYEAHKSKTAKQPSDSSPYRAWQYAPAKVVESESHSPLFITYELSRWEWLKGYWGIKVREPFDDPSSKNYKEVGGSANLIDLYAKISGSELWKTY